MIREEKAFFGESWNLLPAAFQCAVAFGLNLFWMLIPYLGKKGIHLVEIHTFAWYYAANSLLAVFQTMWPFLALYLAVRMIKESRSRFGNRLACYRYTSFTGFLPLLWILVYLAVASWRW